MQDTQNASKFASQTFECILSFERLGRLMDSEIGSNYKALDCWVICAEEFGKKPVRM
jgi:hypothetical protein